MIKSLIVVEDDESVLEVLASVFEKRFQVYTAKNGKEAYQLFAKYRHDAVVTDIVMPVMDGVELTKKIKKIAPNTPIFVVSGAKKMHLEYAAEAGADKVYQKPEDIVALMEEVNNHFD